MLLFVDESGQDHKVMPCEVLAGVAVAEKNYWPLVKAIRSAEKVHFGDYLRNLRTTELKARKLLSRDTFQKAGHGMQIPDNQLPALANSFLRKGLEDKRLGKTVSSCRKIEFVGYGRTVLNFVHSVLDIAANHEVKIFASVVDAEATRSDKNILEKDFARLFERYFFFLESLQEQERGLVVFDELEKSKAQNLIQQMASYFLGAEIAKMYSSKIIPEPFFVHSELTTGVFLADLTAYILAWSWRQTNMMHLSSRDELKTYAATLQSMQFQGQKPKENGSGHWPLRGITYIGELWGDTEGVTSI